MRGYLVVFDAENFLVCPVSRGGAAEHVEGAAPIRDGRCKASY